MRQISTLLGCLISFLSTVCAQDPGNRKIPGLEILKRSTPLTTSATTPLTTSANETGIRIRCMARPLNDKPLFVIDGVVAEEFKFKNINPNDIESICILKNGEATTLFGCMAASGVILITTRTANQRTIIVKDLLTDEVLTGANVDLIPTERRKENIHLITDSLGKVVTNKIRYRKDYELNVTNVGYKTFRCITNAKQLGKNYIVLLERNYENLEDVTVKGISRKLKPRNNNIDNFLYGYLRCVSRGIKISPNEPLKESENAFSNVRFYPNPVLHSQKVSIEFHSKGTNKMSLRLFSLDIKLIDSKEYQPVNGINRIDYFIDAQLASGIYIVQLIDKNNHLVRTEKIIVR